jgi:AcrR family transcriptional regulator
LRIEELDLDKRAYTKLTRSLIAQAALEIIDREGLPGLSMRGLGNHLGVEGMTLYRYFPEKEAILDQVVELVLGGLSLPATDAAWHVKLRATAGSLHERLLLHPNAMPLIASRWSRTPVLRDLAETVADDLTSVGFDRVEALSIMRAVMSFILGYSWLGVKGYVGEIPETGGLTRTPVPPVERGHTHDHQETERLEFERGIDLLVNGARQMLAQGDMRL